MNIVRRVMGRGRIRQAKRRLADEPTPAAYAELAREYARLGRTRDVSRTCVEGLAIFPGQAVLQDLYDGSLRLERQARLTELKHELEVGPRPALWRETCEILLELGRHGRAEETVHEWMRANPGDADAELWLARVRTERFLEDRGRELGLKAFAAVDEVLEKKPRDARAWRLKMRLATRIGAWDEARRCVAQVLRLEPGDPTLEARYRTLEALSDGSTSVERCLVEIERTGRFSDEEAADASGPVVTDARPALMRLAADPDVGAAVYVRGSTALVQGPHGATAERTARSVRATLTAGRAVARRLGLGRLLHLQVDGDFGTLAVAPGELDAGAVWCRGAMTREREERLRELAGLNASTAEEAA
jgi:tetratricopeptide (TPR) repeat protein